MKARRRARSLALQALYEIDCAGHRAEVVTRHRLEEALLAPELEEFAVRMITGVLRATPVLDQQIHKHAPEWPLSQMAIIDRNILRIAIWEFAVDRSTPLKVAINEAVELAKTFGSDSAPRFVNGVLGALALQEAQVVQSLQSYTATAARP